MPFSFLRGNSETTCVPDPEEFAPEDGGRGDCEICFTGVVEVCFAGTGVFAGEKSETTTSMSGGLLGVVAGKRELVLHHRFLHVLLLFLGLS